MSEKDEEVFFSSSSDTERKRNYFSLHFYDNYFLFFFNIHIRFHGGDSICNCTVK